MPPVFQVFIQGPGMSDCGNIHCRSFLSGSNDPSPAVDHLAIPHSPDQQDRSPGPLVVSTGRRCDPHGKLQLRSGRGPRCRELRVRIVVAVGGASHGQHGAKLRHHHRAAGRTLHARQTLLFLAPARRRRQTGISPRPATPSTPAAPRSITVAIRRVNI